MKWISMFLVVFALTACDQSRKNAEKIAELEIKLNLLQEEKNIQTTLNSFYVKVDEKDWKATKQYMADKVIMDSSSIGGKIEELTPDKITASWKDMLKDIKAVHHQNSNFIIKVSGKEAQVFCYGMATQYLPNPTKQNSRMFVGTYDLHLTKFEDKWKIDKFKYTLKFIDGNADLLEHAK